MPRKQPRPPHSSIALLLYCSILYPVDMMQSRQFKLGSRAKRLVFSYRTCVCVYVVYLSRLLSLSLSSLSGAHLHLSACVGVAAGVARGLFPP